MRDGYDNLNLMRSLLGYSTEENTQPQPGPRPEDAIDSTQDPSGTSDMNMLVKEALAKSKADQDIMNNLPDVSGTNDILNKMTVPQQTTPAVPMPPPVAAKVEPRLPAPKGIKVKVGAGIEQPQAVSKSDPLPKEEVTSAPKELSLEEKMAGALKAPDKDNEMLNAQKERKDNLMLLAMLSGAQQIGSGLSHQRPDENYTKDLQQLADLPVSNLKEARASKEAMDKSSMEKQKFVMDTEMGKINFEKAKLGLADEKELSNPNSKASQLARASAIDSLNRMERRDLARQITPEMSAGQISKLFGNMNMSNMVTAYESQKSREAVAKQTAEMKKIMMAEKMDQKDTARLDTASKLIAADLARNNTAFGRNANIIRSSDAIEALVAGKKPNDVTPQQAFEIAKSLDAMLSAGGTTMTGTEHLMPKGAMMKYATLAEFFKNEPQAAMQGGYVKQAMDTIKRERALAQQKIATTSGALLGSYMDLAKKHPESWNTMLQMHGIKPEQVGVNAAKAPISEIQVDRDAVAKELARREKEGK